MIVVPAILVMMIEELVLLGSRDSETGIER